MKRPVIKIWKWGDAPEKYMRAAYPHTAGDEEWLIWIPDEFWDELNLDARLETLLYALPNSNEYHEIKMAGGRLYVTCH